VSGARLEGKMPEPRKIIGTIDAHARTAVKAAGEAALPIVRAEAPGRLGRAFEASVRKTPTGQRVTVAPMTRKRYGSGVATGVMVVRWVTRGTGLYRQGPGRKRKITSRRGVLGTMTLPGGRVLRTVKGQHANPFVARAEPRAAAAADRAIRADAVRAASELRRL
jgi:hypothetical protein